MNTGPQKLLRGARFLKGSAEQSVEGRDMLWRTVGQPTVALAPDVFSGVEFRRVGRKRLDVKPGMPPDELLEFTPAMNRPPIPEQDHRSVQMAQQMPEEATDIQAVEAAGLEAHVQRQAALLGRDRHRANGGDVPLFVEVPRVRRLALRGPGPLKVRNEEEATLVEERQMRPKLLSVFLYAASDTASNARWLARPAAARGVPASDSSTRVHASASRHAPGGTSRDTAFRSRGQSVPGSTSRWSSLRRARPSPAAGSRAASGRAIAALDGLVPVEGAGPPFHASGSRAATETRS